MLLASAGAPAARAPAAAAAFSFAFRTSVARSGLLAVPIARMRFPRRSSRSAPRSRDPSSDDTADGVRDSGGCATSALPLVLLPCSALPPGMGGTSREREREEDDGSPSLGGGMLGVLDADFGVTGEPSAVPSAPKSRPSVRRTVSEPRSACSKSSAVLLVRRLLSRAAESFATGGLRPPERKEDGGGLLRAATLGSWTDGGQSPVGSLD